MYSADGSPNPQVAPQGAYKHRYNDATWDRERNNVERTVLASVARTATLNSSDFTNYNARGLHVVVDVTAVGLTPSITVKIQGKDALSGKYYDLLTSAAITAVGTTALKVYPGVTVAANVAVSDVLPRTYRVRVEHLGTDSITYSVGASEVV